jgi:hypothetical protein
VSVGGFTDPSGQPWSMRGLNAGVQDALRGLAHVFDAFPAMTCLRLNSGGNDSAADIDAVVKGYNARGCVVMIEDHTNNPNNVAWYQQMATLYKGNPLVFLDMPNEPNPTNLVAIQIGLVKAIRGAGFAGPVGLQPAGGYDFSNIGPVLAGIDGTNIFVTPHIYYGGTDPAGPQAYDDADIAASLKLGLFPCIGEFGEGIDGWHLDPEGPLVTSSIIAMNRAGKCGAIYWAMDNGNHPDGVDSAFLTTDGLKLTPTGVGLQAWLKG